MDIISDTNIWIDFVIINALELPFKLSYNFYLNEFTYYDELIKPPEIKSKLIKNGLKILKITEDEFYHTAEIIKKNPPLSRYDALALAIAKKREFILLTGDKRLRLAAVNLGVQVCGTLWIIDELLRERLISCRKYELLLKHLLKHNDKGIRLPSYEIEKRLKSSKMVKNIH